MKYRLLVFMLSIIPLAHYGQGVHETGLLPSININKKLPSDWSINFKVESRQSIIEQSYRYQLTDVSLAGSKKIGINTSIAAGYMMRIEPEGIASRTIQQINFIVRKVDFKLAHRISCDQTLVPGESTEYRFRYRLSSEIPFSGQTLDVKEFFIKVSNEYLNSFLAGAYDLEIRGLGFVGYMLSPAVGLFILLGLNRWLKPSLHMAGLGGLVGMLLVLVIFYGAQAQYLFSGLILVSGLTASARIRLGLQSLLGVSLGFFTGFLATIACMVIHLI